MEKKEIIKYIEDRKKIYQKWKDSVSRNTKSKYNGMITEFNYLLEKLK